MTVPDEYPHTVQVEIKNWADSAKPPVVKNTTVQTIVVDSLGVAGPTFMQIASEEPNRLRMTIMPIDQNIVLCKEKPVVSPQPSSASVAPTGRLLPGNFPIEYPFFGPDAWYI